MTGSAKYLAFLAAFSLLGTCHNSHRDVSGRVRSGHSILVKEPTGRLLKTVGNPGTIEQVAAFMAQHADSWSDEEIFGGLPASHVLLDVQNEKEELLVGVGVGEESLWIYSTKGAWRHLDRRERDRLLRMLDIAPASVPGYSVRYEAFSVGTGWSAFVQKTDGVGKWRCDGGSVPLLITPGIDPAVAMEPWMARSRRECVCTPDDDGGARGRDVTPALRERR